MYGLRFILFLSLLLVCSNELRAETVCVYFDKYGRQQQSKNLQNVPKQFRDTASCFEKIDTSANTQLAKPAEVDIGKSVRRETVSTSLGEIQLRWPRSVEPLFGRTPLRAMTEAASAVGRFLRAPGFGSSLNNPDIDWQVVFIDEKLPEKQIPAYLISNCHPGWMVPPANIYIVSQRIISGCGTQQLSGQVADAELMKVLLHEMGHAIEFELLNRRQNPSRALAEGFATWFEQEAAEYSPLVRGGESRQQNFAWAKESIRVSPDNFKFDGSAYSYARASLYFTAMQERGSIEKVNSVYQQYASGKDFSEAVNSVFGWDSKRFDSEANSLVK